MMTLRLLHALVLGLAIVTLAATVNAADDATLKAGVFEPPRAAPDFTLQGSDGKPLTLGRFRDKVVILGFGFTSCADVCPVTLAVLAEARKKLGAQADELQIVYVTVDPKRDDPARMKEYLTSFDPSFVGGSGGAEELKAVRASYGVYAESVANGAFAHSSSMYLIDRKGALRGLMPFGRGSDDYVHDVRILLEP
jgi:protein SCO1/2